MTGTLNKVMLIGHTGDDVKMHFFEGGNSIGRFPLATNEVYTNKATGQRVENTEWHNVVVRNKAAEICEKYLKKGDKVYVEGRIKTRKWQDDKGIERYSTEIQCTDFTFLTPKEQGVSPAQQGSNAGKSGGDNQQQGQNQPRQETSGSNPNSPQDDDDLPF